MVYNTCTIPNAIGHFFSKLLFITSEMYAGEDYRYYRKYRNKYRALTGNSLQASQYSGDYYRRGKEYKRAYRYWMRGGAAAAAPPVGSFTCDLQKIYQKEWMNEFEGEVCTNINRPGTIKIEFTSVPIGGKNYITSFNLDKSDPSKYEEVTNALSNCSYNTYGFTRSGEIKKTPFPFILNTCVLGSMLTDCDHNRGHLLSAGTFNGIIANIGHGDVYEANLVIPADVGGGVLRYAIARVGNSWRYCTRVGNLGYGRALFPFKNMVHDKSDGMSEARLAKFVA